MTGECERCHADMFEINEMLVDQAPAERAGRSSRWVKAEFAGQMESSGNSRLRRGSRFSSCCPEIVKGNEVAVPVESEAPFAVTLGEFIDKPRPEIPALVMDTDGRPLVARRIRW